MTRVFGAALLGVDGQPVEVEVRISSQLPQVDIVGLPAGAVRESISRVRGAIHAADAPFPDRRVTVNLAPAGLRKTGAALDLPIAVGIVAAQGALPEDALRGRLFLGELALDGRLRPVRGALSLVLAARALGLVEAIVPLDCAGLAALAPGLRICGAPDLRSVLRHLRGDERLPAAEPGFAPGLPPDSELPAEALSLGDVRGQADAKRALEIAAAGGHGLLLSGPPGTGKTMLARRLPGLLSPLDFDEALEVTCIHDAHAGHSESLGGADAGEPPRLLTRRPFRAPHHSASAAGLFGGGHPLRPGEVSLAHHGVLFLDELPEFDRRCLEGLREVLEERRVRLARAGHSCVFPARFQLVAAANPCPCGWNGSRRHDCRCDDAALARYRQRISGPLLDRIDLHVRVGEVGWSDLQRSSMEHTSVSEARAARLETARRRQRARGIPRNADLSDQRLDEIAPIRRDAHALLARAVDGLGLSARAARRALRVARTVADLADQDEVGADAVSEALAYASAGLWI